MKVLYLQPGSGIGGSKVSLYCILSSAPEGQVSQVALASPPEPPYEAQISPYVEKIHYLNLPTWNKYRRITTGEKLRAPFSHVKRILDLFPAVIDLIKIIVREKIDLVHTNNSICAAGAFAAFFAKRPHVWHVREPIGAMGEYPLIPGDLLSAFIFKRFSSDIVCNSAFTANFFRRYGYPVHIVTNGLDLQQFEGSEARGIVLRLQIFNDSASPVVAMIGNVTTIWKKHDLFLAVCAKLSRSFPGCRFVVFGSSSNLSQTEYTRRLERLANDLNIRDRVVWADFINDVPAMMHSLDILIHPASGEGSGRVVMEAMAAGKPVIGVRAGGVQELIQDGVTGYLVSPDDVESMAEKIAFLLRNPRERNVMGIRAGAYARNNFSNETMMMKISDIYLKLI